MDDTEICRLTAKACGLKPYRHYGGVVQNASSHSIYVFDKHDARGYSEYDPFANAEQAAQVRRELLDIGYHLQQRADELIIYSRRGATSVECRTTLDEYRLLAERLARHQKETLK